MSSGRLIVQQALFGYRDGHNFVAGSVELAPRVRQFLANVTDGSGPETYEGFGSAFTGLPVPETSYYALFCTWPAPEMPRPGCVWSHVLLLDLADLARVPSLGQLRSLCVRPALEPLVEPWRYDTPLTVAPRDGGTRADVERSRVGSLVVPLYERPESGVVLLVDGGAAWESAVFAVWSQQWPRLRRSFSFSTGSNGDRRAIGVDFDLQVAPRGSRRLWGRSAIPTVLVESDATADRAGSEPWIRAVLDDVTLEPEGGGLREFLFKYGSDVERPRHAFVRLVRCFLDDANGDDEDLGSRLVRVGKAFPRESDALRLKSDEVGALCARAQDGDVEALWAVVYFLLLSPERAAYERVELDFRSRIGALWRHKRADVMGILDAVPRNRWGDAFIVDLADVLAPEDVPGIWREQPEALQRIVGNRPELGGAVSSWRMPVEGQRQLWSGLSNATQDETIWGSICGAMLGAGAALAESETVSLAGKSLGAGLTEWLRSGHGSLPSVTWREALRLPLEGLLGDEATPPLILALCASVLPNEAVRAVDGHRTGVQELARDGMEGLPEALRLHASFWLAALGLKTPGENGAVLLSHTFFVVYAAVTRSEYSRKSWELIAPTLPELAFGLDWDRCRRLRKGLRAWLQRNQEYAERLLAAAPWSEYPWVARPW